MSPSSNKASTASKVHSGVTTARIPAKRAVPENNIALKKARKANKQNKAQSSASKSNDSTLPKSISPTPEQLVTVLRSADSPRLYFPKDSIPALPVLVDASVLKKIDFSQPKEEITTRILALRLTQAKKLLSSAFKTRISRLPNDFFLYQRNLVSASVSKYSPTAKSPKADSPATIQTLANAKEILEFLHKCDSPRFKFDEQPAFSVLFPGTTKPAFTMNSGNPSVPKDSFNHLLVSRLRSARLALRKAKIHIKALPASFVRDQTRLILQSLVIVQKQKAAKRRKAKAAKAKSTVPLPSKTPEFVPSSTTDNASVSNNTQEPVSPSDAPVTKFSPAWFMRIRPIIQAYTAIARASRLPAPHEHVASIDARLAHIAKSVLYDICLKYAVLGMSPVTVPTHARFDTHSRLSDILSLVEPIISSQASLALLPSLSEFENY
jgi:hypothetical protein